MTGFEMALGLLPSLWCLVMLATTVVSFHDGSPLWPYALGNFVVAVVASVVAFLTIRRRREAYRCFSLDSHATATGRAYQARVKRTFFVVLAVLAAGYVVLFIAGSRVAT